VDDNNQQEALIALKMRYLLSSGALSFGSGMDEQRQAEGRQDNPQPVHASGALCISK